MITLMDSIDGNISLSGNQVAWIVAWVVLECVQGIPTHVIMIAIMITSNIIAML